MFKFPLCLTNDCLPTRTHTGQMRRISLSLDLVFVKDPFLSTHQGSFSVIRLASKALRPGTWRTFLLPPKVKLSIVLPAEANLPAFAKMHGDGVGPGATAAALDLHSLPLKNSGVKFMNVIVSEKARERELLDLDVSNGRWQRWLQGLLTN